MIAPPIFDPDIAAILEPVSESSPARECLRYEGTYDRIMEARREDDPKLDQGVWRRELKRADWKRVSEICLEALTRRSKDLQISAWLLEAWIHLHGFAGVRAGCEVMLGLCRSFWDSLHPGLEDPEYRAAPIHWINEKLFPQLKLVPLFSFPEQNGGTAYSLADWEAASQTGTGRRQAESPITLEAIAQQAQLTPPEALSALLENVEESCELCRQLEEIFDQALGEQACSLSQFRGVLESAMAVLCGFGGVEEPSAENDLAVPHAPENGVSPGPSLPLSLPLASSSSSSLPPIHSRAEAYRRVAEAADYLAQTEPHSPAAYLIRRAVSWENMTLEELLPQLVRNEAALGDIARLLNLGEAEVRRQK